MERGILFYYFFIIFLMIILIPGAFAAHFIVGQLDDALDSTSADLRVITLWNYATGIADNLTDIIGVTGNSGVANSFFIDCELLSTSCIVGDILSLRIFNSGDDYITPEFNVTVTGADFDLVSNLLNTPPNIFLNEPEHYANLSTNVEFNCSATDLDSNLDNITLYGNWSGGWHANETLSISGGDSSILFTKNLLEGAYLWGCVATDNLSISNVSLNLTLNIDATPPIIIGEVLINESAVCGIENLVRVNCTTTDARLGVESVIINAVSPLYSLNYTASLLSGDTYYADIPVNETGTWSFVCFAEDFAENINQSTSSDLGIYTSGIDLEVIGSEINFSQHDPYEGENITIYSTIHNNGCTDANNVLFGFFEGDPDVSWNQIGNNQTISIPLQSNITSNTTWLAEIGNSNIFVFADLSDIVSESNESNNKDNSTFVVFAWQEIYGILNLNKIIGNVVNNQFNYWYNESDEIENIFIADLESSISWDSLQAISRNTIGGFESNDFSEVDSVLGMDSYNDSVSNIMTSDGINPDNVGTFTVNFNTILNVPIVNSTNNTNFTTGILWDTSDDSNGQFDFSENEDLVFAGKINANATGAYGNYDYEVRFPANLRDQDTADSNDVYFYYALP